MTRVLVHQLRGTVHAVDCPWLAGSTVNPSIYDEVDEADVPADAPRCSHCTPPLPVTLQRRADRRR
jgi:hypothetical protein